MPVSMNYDKIVQWYNIDVGVYKSVIHPPPTFECFRDEVRMEFCKNHSRIMKYLHSIFDTDGLVIKTRVYASRAKLEPYLFASRITELYEDIYPQYKELVQPFLDKEKELELELEKETAIKNKKLQTVSNKHKGRRVPNEKATLLEIGVQRKSENNNNIYEITLRTDGRKYWKKLKV
jgi:hypothetical protein